jgi:hypothetical protein
LECLREVPGRDHFEVETRDQLVNGLGLPQVRRQDLRGESRRSEASADLSLTRGCLNSNGPMPVNSCRGGNWRLLTTSRLPLESTRLEYRSKNS